ncbi:hypothetical protein [Phaeobacter inhibens]|uniref:hypothetical protein n=1 Tax=Phaeobacter inhibens TaxID=221822 RepID=UPI0021A2A944|nr:hypothetical protein [Phaeobacter inhibens]UWR73164.1 hypothetical protein K4L00_03390 [Phaeobacter inhibens]
MDTKSTALAGRSTVAEPSASPSKPSRATLGTKPETPVTVVEGVTLGRSPMRANETSHPVAKFKGTEVPENSVVLEFVLANGVTYRGIVADATHVDGEILVEFSEALQPKPK